MLSPGHVVLDSHCENAGVILSGGHVLPDTHNDRAAADLGRGHKEGASQKNPASPASSRGQTTVDAHLYVAPGFDDPMLLAIGDVLDDFERLRVATENRVRSLRQVKGAAGDETAEWLEQLAAGLKAQEHGAELRLKRIMRKHPLGPWVKRTVGLGEKQVARLLYAVGDPTWNHAEDRLRRGPAELWQYCGHGDPERSRQRRGQKVQYSPLAKMRVHLIAESCMKHRHSPYRPVYDAARAAWADRDTSDLHKHNHALRLVGKAILKDLWLEARAVSGQSPLDPQTTTAADRELVEVA